MKRIFMTLGCLIFIDQIQAKEIFYNELTLSLGMAAISYQENQKTIQGENIREAASGSVNAISGNIQYKFSQDLKKSYYVTATFPLLGGEGSYFSGDFGIEFYLSPLASKFGYSDEEAQVIMTPKLRYFWGGEVGAAYLVYNTETATKNDILFNLGILGGASYVFSDSITVKTSIAAIKGTGVVTSTFGVRALVGASFYYD